MRSRTSTLRSSACGWAAMNNVIRLPVKTKRERISTDRYFCLKCDGDTFVLTGDGKVICEQCRSRMVNLQIVPTE